MGSACSSCFEGLSLAHDLKRTQKANDVANNVIETVKLELENELSAQVDVEERLEDVRMRMRGDPRLRRDPGVRQQIAGLLKRKSAIMNTIRSRQAQITRMEVHKQKSAETVINMRTLDAEKKISKLLPRIDLGSVERTMDRIEDRRADDLEVNEAMSDRLGASGMMADGTTLLEIDDEVDSFMNELDEEEEDPRTPMLGLNTYAMKRAIATPDAGSVGPAFDPLEALEPTSPVRGRREKLHEVLM